MVRKQRSKSVNFTLYPGLENTVKEKAFADTNPLIDSKINYYHNLGYKIKLKDEKLLVKLTYKASHMHLLSHRSEEFLAEWLQFSPATIVQIDSRIELEKLKMWANQCRRCKKTVFLRLSRKEKFDKSSNYLFYLFNQLSWFIKRCLDIVGALISIVILSPVFISLALLIKVYFHKPILQTQWCVGKQGKLFCIYKFGANFTSINLGLFGKLPQLFNIIKGDMSFLGRFPWSLAEVRKISLSEQPLVNITPGISASIIGKK
ncbi:MAG: sugar transferase [Rivularia sp. ALOHA_DT_140]|nr:sugar transferase [Rivularia sp. ALOHA_DT_140]